VIVKTGILILIIVKINISDSENKNINIKNNENRNINISNSEKISLLSCFVRLTGFLVNVMLYCD